MNPDFIMLNYFTHPLPGLAARKRINKQAGVFSWRSQTQKEKRL